MNKPLVWSYSFLSTYDRCPRQAQARYINKELPYIESPEAAYGNQVHKDLELAIKRKGFVTEPIESANKFLKDIYAIPCTDIQAELSLGVTRDWGPSEFFGAQVYGRGKADVVVLVNDTTAIMFDHKTGKVREDPFELEVQAVLLQAKYPKLETIKGAYIWYAENKYGEVYDLSSKIEKTKEKIEEIMRKVGQGLFYANKNPLCSWCALTSCRHWKDRSVGR